METILIAAFSARQIARSARAAGYAPLAVDFFNDHDLAGWCADSALLRGHYPDGFSPPALIEALETLARGHSPIGFVYGAGFEDRPEILAQVARRWPVLGNDARTVSRVKDPMVFAQACRTAGVLHPETQIQRPANPDGWLAKRIGGAGGSHVRHASGSSGDPAGDDGSRYFQRRLAGESLSLGFVAAGRDIASLGITRQWCDPAPAEPFRYGGAVGPLACPHESAMVAAVGRLAGHFGLAGLGSADFLVTADGPVLLEINPRAGATLDVYDDPSDPLFAHHLAAVSGRLPRIARRHGVRAGGLAWADRRMTIGPHHDWPSWVADRPRPGTVVDAGEPLCTILVGPGDGATTETQARMLFDRRSRLALGELGRHAA